MRLLNQYIKNCEQSLFRYEGLQDYSAEDSKEFVEKYISTGELTFFPNDSEWWKDIKQKNQQGVVTQRVRLITYPITDYTKAELAF